MLNELDILKDVTQKLEMVNIPFMLTGSLAMNHYSRPRMTRDIDIVVQLYKFDVEKILSVFEVDYYVSPEAIEEAITHSTMFNIIHNSSIIKVDFIIRKKEEFRKVEFERRKKVKFHNFDTYIVSKEDLIISKLEWCKDSHSDLQIKDIKNLLESGYNTEYLSMWLEKLNLDVYYRELFND